VSHPSRNTPLFDQLTALGAEWATWESGPVARRLSAVQDEQAQLGRLALCDLSCQPTRFLKGEGAASWLSTHGVAVPPDIYATVETPDGLRVVRSGFDEFLIESAPGQPSPLWPELVLDGTISSGFHVFDRQDAIFYLCGEKARDVLAQTCGIDWSTAAANVLVMTRLAGVSCSILPTLTGGVTCFQIRLDPTYAIYLWDELLTICRDLEGNAIGAEVLFPHWFQGLSQN